MIVKLWPNAIAGWLLISCADSHPPQTFSGFQVPTESGQFSDPLLETQSGVIEDTISFIAGRNSKGLRAYAGILPNQPEQLPLSGSASFQGTYRAALIRDILIEDDTIQDGVNEQITGTINLTADLAQMTLAGTDGNLTIQADIHNGATISGDMEILGVSGVIEGEIGEDRAFGAFHGEDSTHLMSGGVVAHRQP